MMVTDRVGDFIIRLQNAARIGKQEVSAPYSAHLAAIAKKLKELGFLTAVTVEEKEGGVQKKVVVTLSYNEHGVATLRGVKRISKPGRRLYAPAAAAHRVKGGTGARIISSPAGIISDAEARKRKVGGEELFEIW
ncbi:30S ribosomal protein S8 [Candidatus Kaiserbacteria bacterium RIFCSPLOWO2_02_FULL_54_13]|uniref:Small ribosomal subunit protein uS8 n=1 Tax=Candidatus Kaiserbacteria bacterium RIFCSPHIGHO2_02_FULL_54_22 TaxID=1798495 RepID=A0A1F6DLB8_9BACT|nr:MAG: 30S ribosomal protein S8 [Candidatus Kaiserbacteria bacterium RIFCSPHIGHO2_02_FULL_54_22]OGG68371.1 MAG: 30S ribosomal protein S8 [Candidatus Kaiserbacteria bacterium RIFCSPHIGHO2_12_FULL_54_16]OGG82598.1 MAG: 30S ribosomal protein S8 [Candidatus Kaiserbacteria bacterium RIFCSPLOWO2_02_FULL_54_13]OGG89896.1 MAG: 30S ribosomal protein S8 [Candidatus Kaiserbacteria bacterium RIFCSPLOWO2_12_FULL_54_10]